MRVFWFLYHFKSGSLNDAVIVTLHGYNFHFIEFAGHHSFKGQRVVNIRHLVPSETDFWSITSSHATQLNTEQRIGRIGLVKNIAVFKDLLNS